MNSSLNRISLVQQRRAPILMTAVAIGTAFAAKDHQLVTDYNISESFARVIRSLSRADSQTDPDCFVLSNNIE